MSRISSTQQRLIAGALGLSAIAAIVAVVALRGNEGPQTAVPPVKPAPVEVAEPVPAAKAPAAAPAAPVNEVDVPEMRFLPKDVTLKEHEESPLISGSSLREGNRRLVGVRAILTADVNGPFMSPRFSPDGLQILVTRPGFDGIYVVGINGGVPVKIADGSSFKAKWTADGRIAVKNDDGTTSIYGSDGTLESVEPASSGKEPAFSEGDMIYLRRDKDGQPVALTGNDDQYFGPEISPDGKYVTYMGLHSGVYVAPTDGSGDPIYLGRGTHPQWMPDSSGLIYDRTADDGHNLTDGDIVIVGDGFSEESVLTPDADEIYQNPSPGPDGSSVVFEDDEGNIYAGVIQ